MTQNPGNPAATEAQAQAALDAANAQAQSFFNRWQGVTASEISTSQSFVRELCKPGEVPQSEGAGDGA